MFLLGLGLLGAFFFSFGCLMAAFKSLASLTREAFNAEARLMGIMGFLGGILLSAVFAYIAIKLLERMQDMSAALAR